ncbi:DUF4350 domain-containing protein [soil metagenome]
MTREHLLAVILLVVATASGAWWFSTHFERRMVDERTPPSAEARRNPWLAAQRFVVEMGRPARTVDRFPVDESLERHAVLVMAAGRTAMSSEQIESLLAWINRGGHLIVESNGMRSRDTVLDALGVARTEMSYEDESDDAADDQDDDRKGSDDTRKDADDKEPAPAPPAKGMRRLPPDSLAIGVGDRHLNVTMHGGESIDMPNADWTVSRASGVFVAHQQRGEGQVTVVNDIRFARPRWTIGKLDNAEFLWYLVTRAPLDEVVFAYEPDNGSLLAWLVEHALPVLVMTVALLLAWLWRVVPRFGPVRALGTASQRSLRDHLHATGRFLWDSGERSLLAEAVRQQVFAPVRREHPGFDTLPLSERRAALAASLSIAPEEADRLLADFSKIHVADFIRLATIASRIHRSHAFTRHS